jgi:hypothetical protein
MSEEGVQAEDEIEGPRDGETLHQWMARVQAEHLAEAAKEPNACLGEYVDWIEAHPDATYKERVAARLEIRAKYPRLVEFDRQTKAWADWKEQNPDADRSDKEDAFWDVWGYWADDDEFSEDPDFWEYEEDEDDEP